MVTDLLSFVDILGAAITAGGLVMVLLVLVPILRTSSPGMSLQVHRRFNHYVDRYMPPAAVCTMVAAVAFLLVPAEHAPVSMALTAGGLGGTVGVAVISELFTTRIDRAMRSCSSETVPPDYAELGRRWDRWHALRTACGILAVSCYILAGLLR